MSKRSCLLTLRMSAREKARVDEYLEVNPVFDSFSSLARAATLTFIGAWGTVRLEPTAASGGQGSGRPSFLWDYDMNAAQVREMLSGPGLPDRKCWLMARILSQARFEEVFEYLTVGEIARALPALRLPAKVRERWDYALERWTRDE